MLASEAVKSADDNGGSPVAGLHAGDFEFGSQQSRVPAGFGDPGVDAIDERRDDGRAARMIPVHFLGEVAAVHEKPVADVALQFLSAGDFSHGAGGLTAPQFQLEEPVAGDVIPLREKEVVFVFRVNVGDAPFVAEDFDGLLETGERELFSGRRGTG